ncbi:MAG: hypothetical protein P8I46_05870 [Pseudomonadales bacterium]|nr:hypothetical protein [Pseudomonadales bacterium]
MQFSKARRDSEGKCGEGKRGDAKADEGKYGEGRFRVLVKSPA